VLCVTHLPHIAGHDYYVEKQTVKGRGRTREIGCMLLGERITPEALRYARTAPQNGSECGTHVR